MCADDSLSIILLTVKDFNTFTLKDFKEKILVNQDIKLTGKTIMIEFEGNIIYEFDQDIVDNAGDDEDDLEEIKTNERRLLKTLKDTKLIH